MLVDLKESIIKNIQKYRKQMLVLLDVFGLSFAYIVTWMLIQDNSQFSQYSSILASSCFFFVCCFVVVYYLMGMYDSLWRYAEIVEFFRFCIAAIIAVVIFTVASKLMFFQEKDVPLSIFAIASILAAMLTLMIRLTYRMCRDTFVKKGRLKARRTLIIGAGNAAATIIHEKNKTSSDLNVICAVDDDKSKIGRNILGIEVMGTTKDIPELIEQCDIETILLAIPSLKDEDKRRILGICSKTNCNLKILPDIAKLIVEGEDLTSRVREVRVEDLLGREVVQLGVIKNKYITRKVVMVTGGGGTIGSELCRQIVASNPSQLIIVDVYENNAYAIQQELKRKYGDSLDLKVRIASVRDSNKMEKLFEIFKPEIVFHAAAHKHVPLMEDAPEEAVKNNVFGTLNVARCADKYKTDRFILISTDKAVNPTNIMGATKRICEMIIQAYSKISKHTHYAAVRFGNVLGSNGSVLPLFREQIEQGGPVTVTHKDIVRYFMTIPEAVNLVLEAGFMGNGGDIFVLDMGAPVKILELAENLIKLAGYRPYKDIEIVFSGLRPGEKLYEELLLQEEDLTKTANRKIFIGKQINMDAKELLDSLKRLKDDAYANKQEEVTNAISELVPTFIHKTNGHILNYVNEK